MTTPDPQPVYERAYVRATQAISGIPRGHEMLIALTPRMQRFLAGGQLIRIPDPNAPAPETPDAPAGAPARRVRPATVNGTGTVPPSPVAPAPDHSPDTGADPDSGGE